MKTIEELKIVCNSCEQKLLVNDVKVFSKIECPKCKSKVKIPLVIDELALMEELTKESFMSTYKGVVIKTGKEVHAGLLTKETISQDKFSEMEAYFRENYGDDFTFSAKETELLVYTSVVEKGDPLHRVKAFFNNQKKSKPKAQTISQTNQRRLAQNKKRNKSIGLALPTLILVCGGVCCFLVFKKFQPQSSMQLVEKEAPIEPVLKVIPKPDNLVLQKPVVKKPLVKAVKLQKAPELQVKEKSVEELKADLYPVDYEFDEVFDDFYEYTKAISPELRTVEEKRMKLITYFKDTLIIQLTNKGFSGPVHPDESASFIGHLIKVDDEHLEFRSHKKEQVESYSWQDLKFEQFLEFAEYFATLELNDYRLGDDTQESFQTIAEFHKLLAIVADWYKHDDLARVHKEKAIAYMPAILQDLEEFVN